MMKKTMIALGMSLVFATTVLSGCGVKSDTPVVGTLFGLKSDQIFMIDKVVCTTPEVKLLILNKANKYRNDFGGSVDWNQKVGDTKLGEYIKEEAKNDISIAYTMAALADSSQMEIEDLAKNAISSAASEYYNSLTKEEKEYTEATLEDVETFYTNYYKAKKIYDFLTADVNSEISDEEARVMKIQYIHMDTSKTDVKKATAKMQEIIDVVNGGYQTFAREAKQYTDDELITGMLKKNEATQPYQTAAFELSDGNMSSIITQEDGLYLVYCEKSYLKEETAQNKEDIVENNKNTHFGQIYENYKKDASHDFNTSAWDKIKMPEQENMMTTNIMDVFQTIVIES